MSGDSLTFAARIGVEVKGETWSCLEIPDSAEFFGSGKAVRVDAEVDGIPMRDIGAMPTGQGGHMISLNAKARKMLGKDVGDLVDVVVSKR